MDIGYRIKKILSDRQISVVDFAAGIGVSREYAQKLFHKKDIPLKRLRKISEFLEIPVNNLLNENYTVNKNVTPIEDPKENYNNKMDSKREIELLEREIRSLKETIRTQAEFIKELSGSAILEAKNEVIETQKRLINELREEKREIKAKAS